MQLQSSGLEIVERLSADVPSSSYSTHYMTTKREKLGHLSNQVANILRRPTSSSAAFRKKSAITQNQFRRKL